MSRGQGFIDGDGIRTYIVRINKMSYHSIAHSHSSRFCSARMVFARD